MNWKTMDKRQLTNLIISIFLVVFGVLFCVISQTMLGFIETIVCIALIVYGAFYLLVYCLIDSDTRQTKAVIQGVGALSVGLFIIFIPSFFMIAIGVIFAGFNVLILIRAVKMKKAQMDGWKVVMATSIVFIVLGAGLIVLASVKLPDIVLMIYLGVMLILQGGYNLSQMYLEHKKQNKIVFAEGNISNIQTAETQAQEEFNNVEHEQALEENASAEPQKDN